MGNRDSERQNSGRRNYQAVLADARKGLFSPVYLFYGPETLLCEETIGELTELALLPEERDFNYVVFDVDGDEVDENVVVGSVLAFPAFAKRRVVVIRNADKLGVADEARLAKALERMPSTTLLILWCEKRDEEKKWFKFVAEAGEIIECKRLFPSDVEGWLALRAKRQGIKAERAAMSYLAGMFGSDLARLASELDKVWTYTGTGTITRKDAEAVMGKTFEGRVFALADAVGERNIRKAFRELSSVLDHGEPPVRVLSTVVRQLRLIFQVRRFMDDTAVTPVERVAGSLGVQPFVARKLMAHARNYSEEDLLSGLRNALETDLEIKTGARSAPVALATLLLNLCTKPEPGLTRNLRQQRRNICE